MNQNYHLGLLCLTHLLIGADGEVDDHELDAIKVIKEKEKIPEALYHEFELFIKGKKEREIFQKGIEYINLCSNEEKIKVFVMLYKLSEVDGRVHVKEIRLLLYSIKLASVEFEHVVTKAMSSPSLL